MLLEFELEGEYANELPELYTALQKAQIQQRWDGILDLIKQKQFSKAEKEIEGWEIENAPSNLTKLKEYLQQEKTEFTQHINKRRVLFRTKINGKWGWHKYGDQKKDGKYLGEVVNGKPNGQGTHTWPDGEKYVGEYKDGNENGQGTYTFTNGKKWIGEFRNGHPWNIECALNCLDED